MDIDEIVLVGGSTHIPKIQQLLKDLFDGKEPNKGINPDEAEAYGAAVQGGILSGEGGKQTKVETIGKKRDKVIPRNTTIPARRHGIFTTTEDNQTIVDFMVFEGESSSTKDCHKLGQFQLTGIQCAPKGVPKLEVTFEIDANGKLNVRAVDKATKNSASIVIKTTKEGA
ncbi:Heat shock protein 70 family [Dillenia turbinata]|uniref:Heat shock protein 70 family n=1 Tax=Dillenia turbinata TaxID=194707 RepID=A0AAN8WBD0_9MAGN